MRPALRVPEQDADRAVPLLAGDGGGAHRHSEARENQRSVEAVDGSVRQPGSIGAVGDAEQLAEPLREVRVQREIHRLVGGHTADQEQRHRERTDDDGSPPVGDGLGGDGCEHQAVTSSR